MRVCGQEARATQRYHHLLMGTAAILFTGILVFALLWFLLVKRIRREFDRMSRLLSVAGMPES